MFQYISHNFFTPKTLIELFIGKSRINARMFRIVHEGKTMFLSISADKSIAYLGIGIGDTVEVLELNRPVFNDIGSNTNQRNKPRNAAVEEELL